MASFSQIFGAPSAPKPKLSFGEIFNQQPSVPFVNQPTFEPLDDVQLSPANNPMNPNRFGMGPEFANLRSAPDDIAGTLEDWNLSDYVDPELKNPPSMELPKSMLTPPEVRASTLPDVRARNADAALEFGIAQENERLYDEAFNTPDPPDADGQYQRTLKREEYWKNLPIPITADVMADEEMFDRYRLINELATGQPLLDTPPEQRELSQLSIDAHRKLMGDRDPVQYLAELDSQEGPQNFASRNLAAAGRSIKGTASGVFDALVDPQGNNTSPTRVRGLQAGWQEAVEDVKDEQSSAPNWVNETARGVSQAAPQLIAAAGVGAATKNPGLAWATMLGPTGVDTFQNARASGLSNAEAAGYAAAVTAAEYATAKLGGVVANKLGTKTFEELAFGTGKHAAGKGMKPLLGAFGGSVIEGGEEVAASVGQEFSEYVAGLDEDFVDESTPETLALSFAVGMVASGAMHSLTPFANFVDNPTLENAEAAGITTELAPTQVDRESLAAAASQQMSEMAARAPDSPADASVENATQTPDVPAEAQEDAAAEAGLPPEAVDGVQADSGATANLRSGVPVEPSQTLRDTASWVIYDRTTREPVFETFNPAVVQKLNNQKYAAVPIQEHLASFTNKSSESWYENGPDKSGSRLPTLDAPVETPQPKRRLGERITAPSPEQPVSLPSESTIPPVAPPEAVTPSAPVDAGVVPKKRLGERVTPPVEPPATSPTEQLGLESPQTINDWIDQPATDAELAEFAEDNRSFGFGPQKPYRPAKQVDDTLTGPTVASADPNVEQQWQDSKHRPAYIKKLDSAIEAVTNLKKSFTRKWVELDPKEHGATLDVLRRAEEIPTWGRAYAANVLRKIVAGLGPKKYDVFSRVLILRDLQKDVDRGLYGDVDKRPLPFSYTPETLSADLAKFEQIAKENPDVESAINRRQDFMTTLRNELVDRGLLPESVKDYEDYFHHQVLQYLEGERFSGDGIGKRRLAPQKKAWQKQRTGSELNYNTEYLDAEFAVISQAMQQIKLQESLKQIRKMNDLTPHLKEIAGKDWKQNIPDGYVTWQPTKGNTYYPAMTVSDKALQNYLDGTDILTEEDFREVWARGQKKEEWVIPKELANTLDDFRPRTESVAEELIGLGVNRWKKWRLIGWPFFLRYNLNNMSGDLDVSLAADPKIAGKHALKASKDLQQFHKGAALTPEINRAIELGVIGSGPSSEISRDAPTLTDHKFFSALYGKDEGLLKRLWKTPERFSGWREDILRLAAYRRATEALNAGDTVYWASQKEAIDQMKAAGEPVEVIAARLARDLIGDYGNVSSAGTWMRSHMVPFYSWWEINSPRYVRLFKNATAEGKSQDAMAKKIAGIVGKKATSAAVKQLAKRTVQAGIIYGAINAWNRLVMGDEEDELSEDQQNELHITLGRRDDGTIMYLPIEGALSDALGWVGLEDAPSDIAQVASGDDTVQSKLIDSAKSPVNRIVGGVNPFQKTIAEAALGGTLYPDAFDARPLRDSKEHFARLGIPTDWYRKLVGKPSANHTVGKMLESLIVKTTDPGEAAYYTVRNLTSEWQKKNGDEPGSFKPGARANALYYHKQAIKYKDEELAAEWMARYKAMGGKDESIEQSIERSSPIGTLSTVEQADFIDSLKPNERKALDRAMDWYRKTYSPDAKGDQIQAVYQKAAVKQAKDAVLGFGYPEKKLGEPTATFDARKEKWLSEKNAAADWLRNHKDSPAVQSAVAEVAKKIPSPPVLSGRIDPKFGQKRREWTARYGEAAELVKSLKGGE